MKCKRGLAPAFFLACAIGFAANAAIDPQSYLDDVKYLASPRLKGRETGSPELEKAAHWIAAKFRAFGLQPVDGKSYFQAFPVVTSAKLGKVNEFRFVEDGREVDLKFPRDFVPFNFSESGKLAGNVVFAGYGITAPEYHYDDYAGLDVKGKIVLILRHEPQEFDDHSVFAGRNYTAHAQFASKASNAKMHGAAGVILINDMAHHRGEPDQLEKFGTAEGPLDAGIPFVQVKAAYVEGWFTAAGKNLEDIQDRIDKDLKPESFTFPDNLRVNADLDVERVVKTVHNVVGYLPGETGEYVIIGAHYDHLGLGEQYELDPDKAGTVHPGADDNASGTAGVIELARWFSKQPKQKRGILFMTFSGEEEGLLGSAYYASHPELPLGKAVAMINMDMIGRVRNGKLYIGGTDTGTTLRAMVGRDVQPFGLHIDYSDMSGYGSSDHSSFTAKQVPILFFFSGLHSDYHKATDTWDKIDAPDAAKVLEVVAAVTDDLRDGAGRPQFVRVAPKAPHGGEPGAVSGSGSGYGPWFGSVPDFGEGTIGVKFADIQPGSPAAKAGFKAGDVLVEFDGKPIQNLYDFTYALRARKPGDQVKVKVLRDGKPVEAPVVLGTRH